MEVTVITMPCGMQNARDKMTDDIQILNVKAAVMIILFDNGHSGLVIQLTFVI
jgi:hypothetical protein